MSVGSEELDSVVAGVSHEDVATIVNADATEDEEEEEGTGLGSVR